MEYISFYLHGHWVLCLVRFRAIKLNSFQLETAVEGLKDKWCQQELLKALLEEVQCGTSALRIDRFEL